MRKFLSLFLCGLTYINIWIFIGGSRSGGGTRRTFYQNFLSYDILDNTLFNVAWLSLSVLNVIMILKLYRRFGFQNESRIVSSKILLFLWLWFLGIGTSFLTLKAGNLWIKHSNQTTVWAKLSYEEWPPSLQNRSKACRESNMRDIEVVPFYFVTCSLFLRDPPEMFKIRSGALGMRWVEEVKFIREKINP